MTFHAARQPILNRDKQLIGYELLFRGDSSNMFPDIDGNEATSRLIEGSHFDVGLENITGDKPAYINFTLDTLVKGYAKTFDQSEVVIEIIETVQPGKRLLAEVKDLKSLGYTIALDDYRHDPVWRHFFPYVDLLKIDWLITPLEEIEKIIHSIKDFPNIKLLAEKVETYEQFEQAMSLGFEYFQGYFFARPETIKNQSLAPNQITMAELLYETSNAQMDLKKVTEVFERDVSLSYKLLRYANSAVFKRQAEISTIKQALVILGSEELKRFLSVLFTSQISSHKPSELMRMCLVRGKFAEHLAKNAQQNHESSKAFLTGMFSLIDGIVDQEMQKILKQLPLSNEIKTAILNRQGLLADYLSLVEAYEQAQWEQAANIKAKLNLDKDAVPNAYHEAVEWANLQMNVMGT